MPFTVLFCVSVAAARIAYPLQGTTRTASSPPCRARPVVSERVHHGPAPRRQGRRAGSDRRLAQRRRSSARRRRVLGRGRDGQDDRVAGRCRRGGRAGLPDLVLATLGGRNAVLVRWVDRPPRRRG